MANRKSKRSSKRKTHNRKIMKLIKLTTLVCFLFLVIELVYIGYNLNLNSFLFKCMIYSHINADDIFSFIFSRVDISINYNFSSICLSILLINIKCYIL